MTLRAERGRESEAHAHACTHGTHTNTDAHTHKHTLNLTHTCTHTHTHTALTHTRTRTCTHPCAHTHTHAHAHTCTHSRASLYHGHTCPQIAHPTRIITAKRELCTPPPPALPDMMQTRRSAHRCRLYCQSGCGQIADGINVPTAPRIPESGASVCVCVCVFVCARVCVRACVCARVLVV